MIRLRYEDTKVMGVKSHAEYRMMTVNLRNIPGSDPPVGKTTSGETCSQLAILYHWYNIARYSFDTRRK